MNRHATAIVLFILVSATAHGAQKIAREELGRGVKFAILVDKVMQPQADWVTKEWMVKEAANAGFNVFSPRVGHDRLDEVRQVAEWAQTYGIYHMPWMRGSLTAPDGPEADGKRLVWASGNEQPLWSPNADEFWEWTTRYITAYAQISVEVPSLIGVFLDYENYAPGRERNLYSLSYDDLIMTQFAEAQGIELPDLKPGDRAAWLEEHGLSDAFAAFQIRHWRERTRALREAVDRINPTFQFTVYPAPGTPFMVKAIYPEWATDKAPLILADASSYGRPSKFLPQPDALEKNRQTLLERMEIPRAAGIPFMYAGGIDPVVPGADPEFSGKNAVMISEATDGYWVFYEGPKYDVDHPDYFKWFTWANRAIAGADFDVWRRPRETPVDWTFGVLEKTAEGPVLAAPEGTGQSLEYPKVKLRGENLLLLAAKADQPVEVELREEPVASYRSLLAWELADPSKQRVKRGQIPHGETRTVAFTPDKDGIYLLGVSAGQCAYSIVRSNVPIGLYAGDKLSFIYGPQRLYFAVPDDVEAFSLTVYGSGSETVRVNVLDPTGAQVATGQTTQEATRTTVNVAVGRNRGDVWSLELTRADEGILEDNSVTLGPELPPVLSLVREQVFRPAQR